MSSPSKELRVEPKPDGHVSDRSTMPAVNGRHVNENAVLAIMRPTVSFVSSSGESTVHGSHIPIIADDKDEAREDNAYTAHRVPLQAKWPTNKVPLAAQRSSTQQRANISMVAAVQAAWSVVLQGYSQLDEVSFDCLYTGSSSSTSMRGRDPSGKDQIPSHIRLTEKSSFAELAAGMDSGLQAFWGAEKKDSEIIQSREHAVEQGLAGIRQGGNDTLINFIFRQPTDDGHDAGLPTMPHIPFLSKDVSNKRTKMTTLPSKRKKTLRHDQAG